MLKTVSLHPPSPVRAETHTFPVLRSRLREVLNVAQGYASDFSSAAALLDDRFEHSVTYNSSE